MARSLIPLRYINLSVTLLILHLSCVLYLITLDTRSATLTPDKLHSSPKETCSAKCLGELYNLSYRRVIQSIDNLVYVWFIKMELSKEQTFPAGLFYETSYISTFYRHI